MRSFDAFNLPRKQKSLTCGMSRTFSFSARLIKYGKSKFWMLYLTHPSVLNPPQRRGPYGGSAQSGGACDVVPGEDVWVGQHDEVAPLCQTSPKPGHHHTNRNHRCVIKLGVL